MAFQYLSLSSCNNNFGLSVIIDDSVTSVSVGQTYFISGTTGQPPNQRQINDCFTIKNIKNAPSGPADSLTFSTPYLGCEECSIDNANYIVLKACFDIGLRNTIINIGDITPTPSIGDVFLMEIVINEFGRTQNVTSCFSIDSFSSSSNFSSPALVLSYSSRTDCQDCLTTSPIIHEVIECLTQSTYTIAFPSTGFDNHLITFTDLLGITQYCGIVKGISDFVGITGLLVTDLGIPQETGITCDDCLANVSEKKKIQNCVNSGETQVVWASSLFQAGDSTHLTNANGCYEILPDVVPPTEPITVNELANFDPQNNCEDCLECHGINFDFVTCEEIEQYVPITTVNTIADGFNFASREIYIDSSDKIFTPFQYSGRIGKYDSLGLESNSSDVLFAPWGIDIDESNGIICVSNLNSTEVTFFNYLDLSQSSSVTVPLYGGKKVYFDSIGGRFYVLFANTGVPNIVGFAGASYSTMSSVALFGSASASYSDMIRIGSLFYCLNYTNQQLEVYNLGYAITATYPLTNQPISLDVDYTNTIIYIATINGYIKFNYTTNTFVDINISNNCSSGDKKIKIVSLTNTLVITDLNCNHITEIDILTDTLIRNVTNFQTYGITQIYGMDIDSSGSLWFGSYGSLFETSLVNTFVSSSSSTNELLSVGQTFFNPILSACCEVTNIYSSTNDSIVNITEYPSILNFNDCTECLSTPVDSFYCVDCVSGDEVILVAPSSTFGLGDFIRSQYGNSDWVCFEIVDYYTLENYGDLFKIESNGTVYTSCEDCQLNAQIGITLINTETLQQGQYNITLDVWYQIVGYPSSVPLGCISDKNGVCYQVVNACPIDNVHPLFEPADFYYNQILCRLQNEPLPPVSAGTEYLVCEICEDCCSGATSTLIVPPHPVWTRPNGQQVTLLDAVALGGMFGLNN